MSEQTIIEVDNPDVTVFAYALTPTSWKLRYSFIINVSDETVTEVRSRLIKSFNLADASKPDAFTEKAIISKALLMRNLFRINFGFEAEVVLVES